MLKSTEYKSNDNIININKNNSNFDKKDDNFNKDPFISKHDYTLDNTQKINKMSDNLISNNLQLSSLEKDKTNDKNTFNIKFNNKVNVLKNDNNIDNNNKNINKNILVYDNKDTFNIDLNTGKNKFNLDIKNNEDEKNRIILESKKKQLKDLEALIEQDNNNLNEIIMDIDENNQILNKQEIKLKEKITTNKDTILICEKKSTELNNMRDRLKELKTEYDRIKRADKIIEIEKDLDTIKRENEEYRKFLIKKKEEFFSSDLPSEILEKLRRLYNEYIQLSKQIAEYDNKVKINIHYIQSFKDRLFDIGESLKNIINEEKKFVIQKKQILKKMFSSLKKDLEGVPIEIINKINNEFLIINKERIEFMKNYQNIGEEEKNIRRSVNITNKSYNKIRSKKIKPLNKTPSSYDIITIEKELFEKNKDLQEADSLNNIFRSIEEINLLSYEEISDLDYYDIIKKKELLLKENEKIEQIISLSNDENDKKINEIKFSIEHQQRRVIMLREQNEYISKEINDLVDIIKIKYNKERIQQEIANVEMIIDNDPYESDRKLAILNELYNSIKK